MKKKRVGGERVDGQWAVVSDGFFCGRMQVVSPSSAYYYNYFFFFVYNAW